jgi:hypothetical protein
MIGLGIFFKAEQETGSVAIAGFAIGLNSLAGSNSRLCDGSIWPEMAYPHFGSYVLGINSVAQHNGD